MDSHNDKEVKHEINLSDSSDDGVEEEQYDDDLGSDREVGLNLGEALSNNNFRNKNIFQEKYKDKS